MHASNLGDGPSISKRQLAHFLPGEAAKPNGSNVMFLARLMPRKRSPRSRIIYSEEEKVVFFTNHKVGFSSLNACLSGSGFSKDIRDESAAAKAGGFAGYKKVLVYRHPFERFRSFYADWIVDKGRLHGNRRVNWIYRLMRANVPGEVVDRFLAAEPAEKASRDMLELFLSYYPEFYMKNSHTRPQHCIYSRSGISIDDFDIIVGLDELAGVIRDMFGLELEALNSSSRSTIEDALRIDKVDAVCGALYQRDFVDLKIDVREV